MLLPFELLTPALLDELARLRGIEGASDPDVRGALERLVDYHTLMTDEYFKKYPDRDASTAWSEEAHVIAKARVALSVSLARPPAPREEA